MDRTRRRQGYTERLNTKTGKWERVRGAKPAPAPAKPTATPAAAKPTAAAKPVAKPTAAKPNPYTSGKPNPTAAVRGVKPVLRGVAAAGLFEKVLTPLAMAQEVQDMASRDRRWNDYKERNYGNTRVKPKQGDAQSSFAGARDANLNRINNDPRFAAPKEKPKPPAPRPAGTQPSQPAARPAASRPSTPAAPAKPASPAAPKDRRVSAATANRESGNYGTSRTNNPMIDDAMKARMRQREDAAGVGPVKDGARYAADVKSNTQGVGPVKDGTRYASNLKPSTSTPGKKKEDETKPMSVAERMRRRRAGLA